MGATAPAGSRAVPGSTSPRHGSAPDQGRAALAAHEASRRAVAPHGAEPHRAHAGSTRGVQAIRLGPWRGGLTTTGQPTAASAAATGRWEPPVAASTRSCGALACRRVTRAAIPASAWVTAPWAPVGRTAIARWAVATSRPLTSCGGDLPTPGWPGLARDGRHGSGPRFGLYKEATRRPGQRAGLDGPRLQRSIAPARHVMGILPHHPRKIQGCKPSPACRCSAQSWAAGYRVHANWPLIFSDAGRLISLTSRLLAGSTPMGVYDTTGRPM